MDTQNSSETKVKNDAEKLGADAINAAKEKAAQVKGKMESVGSKIDDMASKAGKEANEMAHSVSDMACKAAGSVASEIRERPVQAAALALAIGIVGTLFYKRAA